jgi:hypothetical protein
MRLLEFQFQLVMLTQTIPNPAWFRKKNNQTLLMVSETSSLLLMVFWKPCLVLEVISLQRRLALSDIV